MATTPTFTAGGLASGLDTNAIVDALVKIEQLPIDRLRTRQTALKSQVSLLGDLASKVSALQTAAEALSSGAVLGVSVSSSNTGFSAVTAAGAGAGRYAVQTTSLAQAAKARSQGFTSGQAPVTGGNLHLEVQGSAFDVAIADGATLADVAASVNQTTGGLVSAVVISDGSQSYLSITNRDTGFTVGGDPAAALVVSETSTGSQGQRLTPTAPAVWKVADATNAHVSVDGLDIERQTNEVTGVIPGVTLSLTANMMAAQDLVLANDQSATEKNLGTFVSAYNAVFTAVQKQLNIQDTTARGSTLAGDTTVRSLQSQMQRLISTKVSGLSSVRTLADLGITTSRSGTLSLDSARLTKAIATDPSAVNSLFSQKTDGLGALTTTLAKAFTDPLSGLFTGRSKSLTQNIASLDDAAVRLQRRVDAFRTNLLAQFTAMETVVSGIKSIGTFLDQQSAQASTA